MRRVPFCGLNMLSIRIKKIKTAFMLSPLNNTDMRTCVSQAN